MMYPELLFALLASATPQGMPDSRWMVVDGVTAQAGDNIVTMTELRRDALREARRLGLPVDSPEAIETLMRESVTGSVEQELVVQAGEDLGLDPARIERAVRLSLDGRRRELGPNDYALFLEEQGLDGVQIGRIQSDEIYSSAWYSKQVGRSGTGERPTRDRYLRPGELRAIYRANRQDMGQPTQVRFQDLVVPVEALGGDIARTKALVENLHERALGGEDFDQLAEEFGVYRRETLGVTDLIDPSRLSDAELRSWADDADEGDFTEVLPIVQRGETVAYHVILLKELLVGAPAPTFDDPRLQRLLRREYQLKRDNAIVERAQSRLQADSYVWYAPGWEPTEPGS